YSFVMIGPKYNVSEVPRHPNLHWLGFKPYSELIYYTQMFDVGIIPFKLTSMVEAVNPIKMWEYMAVGMPVVTTALPEARQYEGLVYHSSDYNEFFSNITRALADNHPDRRAQRLELARNNSWLQRTRQIIRIIEAHLTARGIHQAASMPPINASPGRPPLRGGSYRIDLAPSRQLRISSKTSLRFRVGKTTAIAFGARSGTKTVLVRRGTLVINNRPTFRYTTPRARRSA
ncbi:MAG: glycosyltransferase family 1 protein, partial [Syntrophomonadaceae bacterium]|nr:glycosyltransferase family 1 protein [Syntrophomonadaceae bacterium]